MSFIIASNKVFYKTQGINLRKDMQGLYSENCKTCSLIVKIPILLNDEMECNLNEHSSRFLPGEWKLASWLYAVYGHEKGQEVTNQGTLKEKQGGGLSLGDIKI